MSIAKILHSAWLVLVFLFFWFQKTNKQIIQWQFDTKPFLKKMSLALSWFYQVVDWKSVKTEDKSTYNPSLYNCIMWYEKNSVMQNYLREVISKKLQFEISISHQASLLLFVNVLKLKTALDWLLCKTTLFKDLLYLGICRLMENATFVVHGYSTAKVIKKCSTFHRKKWNFFRCF